MMDFLAGLRLCKGVQQRKGQIMGSAANAEIGVQQAGGGLQAAVGMRYRVQNVTNNARDQARVITLLSAIPESQGGKKSAWSTKPLAGPDRLCPKLLADAIWDFQTFWKKQLVFHNIDGVVDPGQHTWQRLNQLVSGTPEPTTNLLMYDVPLVEQGPTNPICWVACMAMVASERRKVSVGVSTYMKGFDPSNSSIDNPNSLFPTYQDYVIRLNRCGFTSVDIGSAGELDKVLRERGPLVLSHFCVGFPYGVATAPFPPDAMHAVVITGIDIDSGKGIAWFNNPWGFRNQPVSVPTIFAAAARVRGNGPAFAFYRRPGTVD